MRAPSSAETVLLANLHTLSQHVLTHSNSRKTLPNHLQTQDLSKKLKDESGGLDLLGYIEFQR